MAAQRTSSSTPALARSPRASTAAATCAAACALSTHLSMQATAAQWSFGSELLSWTFFNAARTSPMRLAASGLATAWASARTTSSRTSSVQSAKMETSSTSSSGRDRTSAPSPLMATLRTGARALLCSAVSFTTTETVALVSASLRSSQPSARSECMRSGSFKDPFTRSANCLTPSSLASVASCFNAAAAELASTSKFPTDL
mmetsp:Transcript_93420/g.269805  ORF Transcript_93420/g.269805 Transcript_93420/m.269805 type:complete len:202 (+) Transcript_93420:1809-2414(+)